MKFVCCGNGGKPAPPPPLRMTEAILANKRVSVWIHPRPWVAWPLGDFESVRWEIYSCFSLRAAHSPRPRPRGNGFPGFPARRVFVPGQFSAQNCGAANTCLAAFTAYFRCGGTGFIFSHTPRQHCGAACPSPNLGKLPLFAVPCTEQREEYLVNPLNTCLNTAYRRFCALSALIAMEQSIPASGRDLNRAHQSFDCELPPNVF